MGDKETARIIEQLRAIPASGTQADNAIADAIRHLSFLSSFTPILRDIRAVIDRSLADPVDQLVDFVRNTLEQNNMRVSDVRTSTGNYRVYKESGGVTIQYEVSTHDAIDKSITTNASNMLAMLDIARDLLNHDSLTVQQHPHERYAIIVRQRFVDLPADTASTES